jgi:hypothetical protein
VQSVLIFNGKKAAEIGGEKSGNREEDGFHGDKGIREKCTGKRAKINITIGSFDTPYHKMTKNAIIVSSH